MPSELHAAQGRPRSLVVAKTMCRRMHRTRVHRDFSDAVGQYQLAPATLSFAWPGATTHLGQRRHMANVLLNLGDKLIFDANDVTNRTTTGCK